jgi:hypothetical protein
MEVNNHALDVICVFDETGTRVLSASEFQVKLSPSSLDFTRTAFLGPGSTSIRTHDVLEISRYDDRAASASYSNLNASSSSGGNIKVSSPLFATNARARISQNCSVEFFDHILGCYTLTPSPEVLLSMNVAVGSNRMRITHPGSGAHVEFCIWAYTTKSKIVVVDVDGTITRSSVRGYVHTVFMHSYTYIHEGVAEFLQTLVYDYDLYIVYLTSRPVFHLAETRQLLFNLWNRPTPSSALLPSFGGSKPPSLQRKRKFLNTVGGPVFANRESLAKAAYRELISQDTISFKSQVLMSILDVFSIAHIRSSGSGETSSQNVLSSILPPLFMAFGNKDDDAIAYAHAGIAPANILIIDKSSRIKVWSSIFQRKMLSKQQLYLLRPELLANGASWRNSEACQRSSPLPANLNARSSNRDSDVSVSARSVAGNNSASSSTRSVLSGADATSLSQVLISDPASEHNAPFCSDCAVTDVDRETIYSPALVSRSISGSNVRSERAAGADLDAVEIQYLGEGKILSIGGQTILKDAVESGDILAAVAENGGCVERGSQPLLGRVIIPSNLRPLTSTRNSLTTDDMPNDSSRNLFLSQNRDSCQPRHRSPPAVLSRSPSQSTAVNTVLRGSVTNPAALSRSPGQSTAVNTNPGGPVNNEDSVGGVAAPLTVPVTATTVDAVADLALGQSEHVPEVAQHVLRLRSQDGSANYVPAGAGLNNYQFNAFSVPSPSGKASHSDMVFRSYADPALMKYVQELLSAADKSLAHSS